MADASDLTSKALQIVGDAQGYLTRREEQTQDPEELDGIRGWRVALQDLAAKLQPGGPAPVPAGQPLDKILSEQLDLSRRHIGELHEYYDYANVEVVMATLQKQLQMMAGPHGPGKGRPGDKLKSGG